MLSWTPQDGEQNVSQGCDQWICLRRPQIRPNCAHHSDPELVAVNAALDECFRSRGETAIAEEVLSAFVCKIGGRQEKTYSPPRKRLMYVSRSNALVLFGVTGDFARMMIFRALYAMVAPEQLLKLTSK